MASLLEVEAAPVADTTSSNLRGRWSHGLDWSVVLWDRLDPYRRPGGAPCFHLAGTRGAGRPVVGSPAGWGSAWAIIGC